MIAGLLEVVWAIGLKYTAGFTKLAPSLLTLGAMIVSFYLLALALKTLSVPRLLSIGLIVGGIVSLKLATPG